MQDTTVLLADFFAQDDLARLTADAGELLDCPLMVIDDAFRVAAHYAPPGFADPLFDRAVQQGAITYEAGAIISRSPALSARRPDYVEVADSTRRRRFAPLISAGVRLGYLVCVDIDGHLADIPAETFRTAETVLAKQLFVEASRQDKPFGTAEEILMHLLDGGLPSAAYFRLQASSTYLADFHPAAFALIDLAAYHALYLGKSQLKDELTYRFYASHPFLYQGDVILFLHEGYDPAGFDALVEEFHLKVVISGPITDLYGLPALYRTAREALDLVADAGFCGGSVYHVEQLRTLLMLTAARRYRILILPQVKALAACDREKGSQYCETLYTYLTCGRSLKDTCAALFTHRNTVLYRIHKMREDFAIPLDDPTAYTELLLSTALILLDSKGAEFFIADPATQAAKIPL